MFAFLKITTLVQRRTGIKKMTNALLVLIHTLLLNKQYNSPNPYRWKFYNSVLLTLTNKSINNKYYDRFYARENLSRTSNFYANLLKQHFDKFGNKD